MSASLARYAPFAVLFGFSACPKDDTDPPVGDATWQLTCGDPVCGGHSDHGTDACTSETAGAACGSEGARCDPGNDCNADLLCTTEDPATNCPISLASAKTDIRYLTDAEIAAVAGDLGRVRLATWRYKGEPTGGKPHLGFVIDDLPAGSPAVRADGGHVDLYGYASMNAAAVQAQQARIDALEARIAELERAAR